MLRSQEVSGLEVLERGFHVDVPVDFAFEGVTRLLLEHQDWDCEDKTDEDTFTTFG